MRTLFNVSNRLPVTIKGDSIHKSSGGLVAALQGLPQDQFKLRWIGWPGGEVADEVKRHEYASLFERDYNANPVFLSDTEVQGFYEGLSNSALWPLLHAMPSYLKFDPAWWSTYEAVNQKFADTILQEAQDGDLIWVHDYQLFLLPRLLKSARPALRVGFFLHTPFPPYDVFRYFPRRCEIIEGLLGADLIGFHTFSYLRHFHETATRLLTLGGDGTSSDIDRIHHNGHLTTLGVHPIGIHAEKFDQELASAEFTDRLTKLRQNHSGPSGDRKVVLSVERLDYTKGILHRLDAIDLFLSRLGPEDREKLEFVFISVPSREGVEDYRDLRQEVETRVGRLNGKYATLNNSPIHFIHGTVNFSDLVALYAASDVALVTPLVDGMNLVAKEFIAARPDNLGVLILSEFAGAAEELVSAVRVNPHDTAAVADAIADSLAMPDAERLRRSKPMRERVMHDDAKYWARSFVESLEILGGQSAEDHAHQTRRTEEGTRTPTVEAVGGQLAEALRTDAGALLLLDYDGTLREIVSDPHRAGPTLDITNLLARLTELPGLEVAIVSGRIKEDLDTWMGEYPFTLVAEHGAAWRPVGQGGSGWVDLVLTAEQAWKDPVLSILKMYERLTPGSWVEIKRTSLVWHYRGADPDLGEWRASRLLSDLATSTANLTVNVRKGRKIVEVGDAAVSKGATARRLLRGRTTAFMLCAGDDATDETMFHPLPVPSAFTIKIGQGETTAQYRLPSPSAFRKFLHQSVDKALSLLSSEAVTAGH